MLFLIILFLATSSAERTKHEPCCWAGQHEVTGTALGKDTNWRTGNLEEMDFAFHIKSDFLAQMLSVSYNVSLPDGSTYKGRSVVDYNRMIGYDISNEERNCSVWRVPSPMPEPCIPRNATYMDTQYLGYGNAKVEFDTWYYPLNGTDREVHIDIAPNACVPILKVEDGTANGERVEMVMQFRNYMSGLSDQYSFTGPTICKAEEARANFAPVGRRSIDMFSGVFPH